MALSSQQKQAADSIWDKLVSLAGFRHPGFRISDLVSTSSITTTANMTLWVDQAKGDDIFDGTVEQPFKTIGAALARVPFQVRHTVAIMVKAGTYSEDINLSYVFTNNGGLNEEVRIEGADFLTPTLGSGSITSGTLGVASALPRPTHNPSQATGPAKISYAVAGAAWTAHELKGMFVKISSTLYPIADNTATTLEIPVEGLASSVFSIVTHGAILAPGPNSVFWGVTSISMPGSLGRGIHFKNLAVVQTTKSFSVNVDGGKTWFEGCLVNGGTCFYVSGPMSSLLLQRCFVLAKKESQAIEASNGEGVGVLGFNGTVMDGNGGTGNNSRLIYIINCTAREIQVGGLLILQNAWMGMSLHAGPALVLESSSSAHIIVRNMSGGGIDLCSGSSWLVQTEIFNITGTGFAIRNMDGNYPTGGNRILGSLFIEDVTGDGIVLGSKFNALMLQTGDISGCGGVGIRMNPDVHSSHNAVSLQSAGTNFTMGNNTGGDILVTYNGAAQTLAALHAAVVTVDANSFTRIDC